MKEQEIKEVRIENKAKKSKFKLYGKGDWIWLTVCISIWVMSYAYYHDVVQICKPILEHPCDYCEEVKVLNSSNVQTRDSFAYPLNISWGDNNETQNS